MRLLIIGALLFVRATGLAQSPAPAPVWIGRGEIPWTILPSTIVPSTDVKKVPLPSWFSFIVALGAGSGNENHFDAERDALIERAKQEGLTKAVVDASADLRRRRRQANAD